MKAIMISDKPKWSALMMNGIKKIEIRKNKALASAIQKLIAENGYADIYVYCTKDEELFYSRVTQEWFTAKNRNIKTVHRLSNGIVKFKFRCYKVEEILITPHGNYYTNTLSNNKLQTQSCLSNTEIFKYTNCHITIYGYCVCGYAIHISDLEIFDKPKELSEFKQKVKGCYTCHYCGKNNRCVLKLSKEEIEHNCYNYKSLTKAPQNMVYVEVEQ